MHSFLDNTVVPEGGFIKVLPPCLFDVGLPTLDVCTDLSLIIPWYMQGHLIYAGAMTVPLMMQLLSSIFKWVKLEKSEDKIWSWIFVLLQLWPQLRALRWIRLVYKGDPKALEKKNKMMAEIGTTEAFLEAWPSVIIMTCIFIHANQSGQGSLNTQAVFGDDSDYSPIKFLFTYLISVATAALGVTKILQIGPCPILSDEGTLGGLLTWRFFINYMCVLCSLVSKGTFIAFMFVDSTYNNLMVETLSTLLLLFIPNILFSFFGILMSTGCNRKRFFSLVLGYPGLWLLSAATFFSVGPKSINCCSQNERGSEPHKLVISKVFTVLNMIVTVISYVITFAVIYYIVESNNLPNYIKQNIIVGFTEFVVPLLTISIIFAIISLLLDLNCCCAQSQKCLCSCCCGPGCFKFKHQHIYTDPETNAIEICKND